MEAKGVRVRAQGSRPLLRSILILSFGLYVTTTGSKLLFLYDAVQWLVRRFVLVAFGGLRSELGST